MNDFFFTPGLSGFGGVVKNSIAFFRSFQAVWGQTFVLRFRNGTAGIHAGPDVE